MKKVILSSIIMTIFMLALASIATADVPQMINYQGRLTDENGDPVPDDNYEITFTLYRDAGGTNPTGWSETHATVAVEDGLFSVLLGSSGHPFDNSDFDESELYLGISVEGDDEIEPRTRIASLPYAFRISTIDGATGGTVTSEVDIYDNDVATNSGGLGLEYAGGTGGSFTLANGTPYLMSGAGKQLRISTVDGSGQAIVIDNRDVGIGTTSPAAKLHVNGNVYTLGGSGDVDLTGDLNIADFDLMVDYLNQETFLSEGSFAEADLDGDGRVTWDDKTILERILFYAGTKDQASRWVHSSYGVNSSTGDDVFYVRGQAGIGTTNPQGALDVSSTTGALIVPRMTTAQRNELAPVNGMIIYNTTDNQFNFYENGAWVTK